jgi:hypothetical protein
MLFKAHQTPSWQVEDVYKSKKNIQRNGQKKKYKRTNKDLQNIKIKLKIE